MKATGGTEILKSVQSLLSSSPFIVPERSCPDQLVVCVVCRPLQRVFGAQSIEGYPRQVFVLTDGQVIIRDPFEACLLSSRLCCLPAR